MRAARAWAGYVGSLATKTVSVWWRTLPRLLAAYLLGWFGYQASIRLSAWVASFSAWGALVVVSMGFVSILSGTVICLRILGQALDMTADVPRVVSDDRDDSVSRLLAVTLLPFLGIYATFNRVTQAADRLVTYYLAMFSQPTEGFLTQLNPTVSPERGWTLFGVLIAAYLLRRGLDLLHEKTDFKPLGLGAAFVEGFFMLTLLLSGQRLILEGKLWLDSRAVWGWFAPTMDGLHHVLASIHDGLPELLIAGWRFWADELWPGLVQAVGEPILWLAVAVLVYGTHTLSLAEMWRKGKPLSASIPTTRRGRRRSQLKEASSGGRRAWLEVQEAFFGDIDDKYLPTFQSLRLVVGVGLEFLGAFVVLYTVLAMGDRWLPRALAYLVGGHPVEYWTAGEAFLDLLTTALFEPLRLALLAVAFKTVLRLFHQRAVHAEAGVAERVRP